MNSVLDDVKTEQKDPLTCNCAPIGKALHDLKTDLSTMLEDGKRVYERFLKRARYGFEDDIQETAHIVRRHPIGSVAIAFAIGTAVGILIPRGARK